MMMAVSMNGWKRLSSPLLAAALCLFSFSCGCAQEPPPGSPSDQPRTRQADGCGSLETAVMEVASTVGKAVVSIETQAIRRVPAVGLKPWAW